MTSHETHGFLSPQPSGRRHTRWRAKFDDQLRVLSMLIVRTDVVQDVSDFHGGSLRVDPYGRYWEQRGQDECLHLGVSGRRAGAPTTG